MNPDTLKPLTVSTEAEILMNLMEDLKSAVMQLLPLLDLLKTPQGEDEQDMIRRLLSAMTAVEAELSRSTDWREAFDLRQVKMEKTQDVILRRLEDVDTKITDMLEGFMALIAGPNSTDG